MRRFVERARVAIVAEARALADRDTAQLLRDRVILEQLRRLAVIARREVGRAREQQEATVGGSLRRTIIVDLPYVCVYGQRAAWTKRPFQAGFFSFVDFNEDRKAFFFAGSVSFGFLPRSFPPFFREFSSFGCFF